MTIPGEKECISMEPLVSVLVLCYNNQKYIYETLQSIFAQTYSNIEVLISDDASEDLKAEPLLGWIRNNKTPNIKRIELCENEENRGTVFCIENLRKRSRGKYLLHIAADDALHSPHVLERACKRAEELGTDDALVFGQTEMWDSGLKNKLEDFIKADTAEFLKTATAQEIFAETSYHMILPACFLYSRSLIEKVGTLSDHYRLVEDWPMHLRITRMGIRPVYMEDVPFLKHRDGGISHGNQLQSKKTFVVYYEDILKTYLYEVRPYEGSMNEADRKRAQKYYNDRVSAYRTIHVPAYLEMEREVAAPKKEAAPEPIAVQKKLSAKQRLRQLIKRMLHRCSSKKVILTTGVCFLLLFVLAATAFIIPTVDRAAAWLLAAVCCAVLLLLMAEVAAKILLKLRRRMWDRRGY